MKSILSILLILIVHGANAQTTIEQVAECMSKHKYNKVYRNFDETMRENITRESLQEIWEGLEASGGKLISVEDIVEKPLDGGIRQSAILTFERTAVQMRLAQNEDKQLSGLFISLLGYEAPTYGEGLVTGKRRVMIKSGEFSLPGELMIPINCNQCPVVILVHGSGPNDKDETIGASKVFYDLALGLASKGIATFRYDKRSKIYPESISKQFDLYDETINDAIAAFYVIKNDSTLDFGKHIMLGHSLGAYAMPLIADSLGKDLDGAVLFSANARRLEDLIDYQMKYLTEYDDLITDDEEQIIIENTARAQNIRDGNYTLETSAENLLAYWPGTFWDGIKEYSPVQALKQNTTTPFFIMQGEKDYQITMIDFSIWRKEVGNMPNVKMLSFPGLTHLFTPTDADRPSPQDYFLPNNVDEQVILELADWVRYVE
jgi:pimeloyl-ACP methyl ester carboxylesterase